MTILSLIFTDYLVVALALVLSAVLFLCNRSRRGRNGRLPPGPRGVPFLGNLPQMPTRKPHLKFLEWAHQYGEIFHLRLGPQSMIVLNTQEAADELLTRRRAKYSGRTAPHVAHDLMSDGQRMVFMGYTREYKASRKCIQGAIGTGPAKRLRELQELESRVMLKDLLDHGDQSLAFASSDEHAPVGHWFGLVRRFATSLMFNVTYGQRVHTLHNIPEVDKIYEVVENFTEVAQPGAYLADAFPILRTLPDWLAPWRAKGRRMHEWEMQLWGPLFERNKAQWRTTTTGIDSDPHPRPNNLISSYLSQRARGGHEEAPGRGLTADGQWMRDKLLTYTAATLLEAGSDTVAASLLTFVLLMLAHPHALRKAQQEVDAVVGSGRMPGFEDEERLPYVVACIKETMRCAPVAPLAIPHQADEDDVYNGYFIPKGATVVGNVWAMHMDPVRFPDPTAFKPERFYTPGKPTLWQTGSENDVGERDNYEFGWGRRYCAGRSFATASLFIACARMIWGLDLIAPNDERTKQPIVPDVADEKNWGDGFISVPHAFTVVWKARDEEKARVIQDAFKDAQESWRALGMPRDER